MFSSALHCSLKPPDYVPPQVCYLGRMVKGDGHQGGEDKIKQRVEPQSMDMTMTRCGSRSLICAWANLILLAAIMRRRNCCMKQSQLFKKA